MDKALRIIGLWALLLPITLCSSLRAQTPETPPSAPPATQAVTQAVTPPATPPATPATPAGTFNASADSLTVLVEYRPQDEIQRDLNTAVSEQSRVVQNLERARMMEVLAENRIRLKQVEIDGFDTQIDMAKVQKNDLLKKDYESRKKLAETERGLLERRRDLRSQEIAIARALKEYYEAGARIYQIELELAAKRAQRASLGPNVNPALAKDFAKLQRDIRDLERKVLDAQVDEAGKWKTVAGEQQGLAKARMKVFESQLKVEKQF